MFGQFTDRSLKIIGLANEEAIRLNRTCLSEGDILLGLILEGKGVAGNVLRNLGITLDAARRELERLRPSAETATGEKRPAGELLPLTPSARRAIEIAIEEAGRLSHSYIGSEHLILGVIREPGSVAAQVLSLLGQDVAEIREDVLSVLGHSER